MKMLARQLFSDTGAKLFELPLADFTGNGMYLAHNYKLLETAFGSTDALSSRVSWIGILKSKILLSAWGEFPAFDHYYMAACRTLYPCRSLTNVSSGTPTVLHRLIGEERLPFPRLEIACKGLLYPIGCLVDMAFFRHGLESV